MKVNGIELLQMIKDGKIKEGTKFKITYCGGGIDDVEVMYKDNCLFWYNEEADLIEPIMVDTLLRIKYFEIIEEDTPIEELLDNSINYNFSKTQNGMTKEDRRLLDSNFKELGKKINEVIRKINDIESRGNE